MIKKVSITLFALVLVFLIYSHFSMYTTNTDFLDRHLDEIEEKIANRDMSDKNISSVPVSWHLDHSLKTINRIYEAMASSDPSKFEKSISIPRTMSLTMNFIPRGRAESPASVRPPEIIETDALWAQLKDARENINKAFELNENAHFDHPVFGTISRGNTLRFLEVHTEHHLKIMRDIIGE